MQVRIRRAATAQDVLVIHPDYSDNKNYKF